MISGIGGIPTGDKNDQITLTSCTVVGGPEDFPEPHPIVWGTQWTLPLAYEVLIGQKNDPFCFQTFPGADSVSSLLILTIFLMSLFIRKEIFATESKLGPRFMTCLKIELSERILSLKHQLGT